MVCGTVEPAYRDILYTSNLIKILEAFFKTVFYS
jgi:hypothetical protein